MYENHTSWRKHQLSGPGGKIQTWTPGGSFKFYLKNLPLLTLGRLANYLVGIELTFGPASLQLPNASAEGRLITPEVITSCLIGDAEVAGAWHGTPLARTVAKGQNLSLMEFLSCGYRWFSRPEPIFNYPTGDEGTQSAPYRHKVFLPLSHFLGKKGRQTAQLAYFYKDAELTINCRSQAAIDTFLANMLMDSDSSIPVTAQAILLPLPELFVGPGVEYAEYRQAAASGNNAIDLDSFGNTSGLQGVEAGAGIDFLAAMATFDDSFVSPINGDGSFLTSSVTRVSVPFLGQDQTDDISAFFDQWTQQAERYAQGGVVQKNETGEFVGVLNALRSFPYDPEVAASFSGLPVSRFLPILVPGLMMQTSKLPIVEGTQTMYIDRTVGGANDRSVAHQYKSWNPAKWADAKMQIEESGLAMAVLGTKNTKWGELKNEDNSPVFDRAKGRFIPQGLVPAT